MQPNPDLQAPLPVNPYTPPHPEGQAANEFEIEIPFAATVTVADVRRASRRPTRVIVTASILTPLLLASGLVTLLLWFSPTGRLPWLLLVMVGLMLFVLAWELWYNLGPGLANWRLRAMPHILGEVRGTISKQWLCWERENISSTQRTAGCSYARAHGGVLEYSLDQRRLSLSFLPERAFRHGDFDIAAKWLKAAADANRLQPASGMVDARLLDASQVVSAELPENAIRFRGPLKARDLLTPALRAMWGKALRRSLLVVALLNVPLLIGLIRFAPFSTPWIFCLAFLLYLNWRAYRVFSASFGWSRSPDKTIMEIVGAVSDREVMFATALGYARYQWSAFTELAVSDTSISLRLPGNLGHHVILARHQLEDPKQWELALTTTQAAFQDSRAESTAGPSESPS